LNRVYRKYGKKTHPKPATRKGVQKNGEVSTVPTPGDEEYVSTVIIGGQSVRLDFDTGSSDL
jgi:hypothetical protein